MVDSAADPQDQWAARLRDWKALAERLGFAGMIDALQETMQPFGPLAAQILWVAQPTFALFGEAETISALAALLENQDAVKAVSTDNIASSEGGNG